MREEEFLIQLWLKVNPVNEENVDSHIVLEFMKLIYDPYCASSAIAGTSMKNLERLIIEYVEAIRKLSGLNESPNAHDQQSVLWSVADIMRALRFLTDNYSGFKGGGATGGISVPSLKQRKSYFEAFKECTFKPTINKNSEAIEK